MRVVQSVLNCFGVALLLVGAVLVALVQAPLASPRFMLAGAVPLVVQLLAWWGAPYSGVRILALAVNWLGAVLACSLAAAASTGIGGTAGFVPLLGCAAVLYFWNTVGLVRTSLT